MMNKVVWRAGGRWTCDAGGYYWPMYFTDRLACMRRSNRDVICWLVADVLGFDVPVPVCCWCIRSK